MLILGRAEYDAIIEHATDGRPAEVCGILAGEFGETRSKVTGTHRATNVSERPRTEYYMDPEEQLALIDKIDDAGDELVGFYHSHPKGPTIPSQTDANRATWPGYSYVIIALDGYPYVGSWRWTDDEFEQETVGVDGL